MARKRKVSEADSYYIYHYIKRKFRNESSFPSITDNQSTRALAMSDFQKIVQHPKIDRKKLLEWCYIYLSDPQWSRLKIATRRRNQRDRRRQSAEGAHIGIELSHAAHRLTSKLAEYHGMTPSEFLEDRLAQEFCEKILYEKID